ncbi:MAG: hypothetical protein MZV65_39805 [Chromatiales bacterium]|nr:hypothetical protein [Chromatiales bacterium]
MPNPLAPLPSCCLPERGRFRERLGLTAAPLLMYLGTLSPRKQPAMLARAAAVLGEARRAAGLRRQRHGRGTRDQARGAPGRARAAHAVHGPARRARALRGARGRGPASSTRPTARCSAWCRSRPCRLARRSSCRTTAAAARSSASLGGGLLVAAGEPGAARRPRSRRSSPTSRDGARRPRRRELRRRGVSIRTRWPARLEAVYREVIARRGRAMTATGVSFVVPVHNGERWLDEALDGHPRAAGRAAVRSHRR